MQAYPACPDVIVDEIRETCRRMQDYITVNDSLAPPVL
ncbi:hypothetical protein DGWBC_1315 [Dehalogenimonas sp. WBC-2]|nr:hypothetical protein DGWBC_1315 [Dehalogenimonas sp. WBC-2]